MAPLTGPTRLKKNPMPRHLEYIVFVIALFFCACESTVPKESTFPNTLTAGDTLHAIEGEIVLLDSVFAIYGIRPIASPRFILDPGIIDSIQGKGSQITFSAIVEREPPGVKTFGVPIRIIELEFLSEQ